MEKKVTRHLILRMHDVPLIYLMQICANSRKNNLFIFLDVDYAIPNVRLVHIHSIEKTNLLKFGASALSQFKKIS